MNLADLQSKINALFGYTPSEADLLADPNLIDISIEAMRANVANLSDVADALNACFGSSDTAQSLITRPDRIKLGMAILAADNTGNGGAGSGNLLQTQSLFVNTTASISVGGIEAQNTITGFEVAITPSSATSKILVFVSLHATVTQEGGDVNSIAGLLRGSTPLGNPTSRNGFAQGNYGNSYGFTSNSYSHIYQFLDSPNTTNQIIYKPTITTSDGDGAGVIYFNRNNAIPSNTFSSSVVLMEIAP